MKNKLLSVLMVLGMMGSAFAQDSYSDGFYEIESVELEELSVSQAEIASETLKSNGLELGQKNGTLAKVKTVVAVANELIALGERIYKIVEKGRPVLNVASEPVSVLPRQGATYVEARELSGWSVPTVKKYRVAFKNTYRMEVAALTVMLVYSHGGSHEGRGSYITDAQIKPVDINLMWGYKMDVNFKVQSITNLGSQENPVAGAVLMLDYSVSTVLQTRTGNRSYFISGDGTTTVL